MSAVEEVRPGIVRLCVIAAVAGVAIGVVGGAFRWCLGHLDRLRVEMLEWAAALPGPGWLVPIGVTAAGAGIAAAIVRLVPLASGSGIQHVEAVQRGEASPPPLVLLPARFLGGLLSIGSGLILGREGPTVHMGAAIGATAARQGNLNDRDVRQMQTSVGGAGLAVAFNAPIGGALFVIEEAAKSVRLRVVVPTLVAVAAGVGCAGLIIGDSPDFRVGAVETPSIVLLPLFVVFGLVTGAMGVVYNRVILGALDMVARFRHVSPIVKAALIGAVVGALLAIDPLTAGGGDTVAQRVLDGGGLALPLVAALFLIRFVAGPLSYAAATPGGLFAPLLALGALWGMLFAAAAGVVLPGHHPSLAVALAIVGMSALFGAVVGAPVTGVVIVMEMTATTTLAVPMLAATAAAVLVSQLLGSPPIYDSLRERMLAAESRPRSGGASSNDDETK